MIARTYELSILYKFASRTCASCAAEHGAATIALDEEEESETHEHETLREQLQLGPTRVQCDGLTASTRVELLAESKPHVEEASADAHIGLHSEEAAEAVTAATAADRAVSQCAVREISCTSAVIASAVCRTRYSALACSQVQMASTELIACADTDQTAPAASVPLVETLRAFPLQCHVHELPTPVYCAELLEAPVVMCAALEAVYSMQCTTTRREETAERLMAKAQLSPLLRVVTSEPLQILEKHVESLQVAEASATSLSGAIIIFDCFIFLL